MFFFIIIFGTIITISANSWFRVWIGIEINLLSFVPLITRTKNLICSESSLKYFLTQALASRVFLFSILFFFIILNFKINLNNFFLIILSFNLLLKRGSAPFHFWLPNVIEGLSWQRNMVIITWQKIAPLLILSYCLNFFLLNIITIFSIIFGSLGGLNQSSLRKLIAYSSINHLGWIIIRLTFNEFYWILYFLFYCFLRLRTILIFNNFKLYNINQTFNIKTYNILLKFSLFCSLLSLGGLPPFLGFFPKWLIIELIIFINIYTIILIILFFTLITLFFYLRICYSAFIIFHLNLNWNFKLFFFSKPIKLLIFFSFLNLFGLIIIFLFYNFL